MIYTGPDSGLHCQFQFWKEQILAWPGLYVDGNVTLSHQEALSSSWSLGHVTTPGCAGCCCAWTLEVLFNQLQTVHVSYRDAQRSKRTSAEFERLLFNGTCWSDECSFKRDRISDKVHMPARKRYAAIAQVSTSRLTRPITIRGKSICRPWTSSFSYLPFFTQHSTTFRPKLTA